MKKLAVATVMLAIFVFAAGCGSGQSATAPFDESKPTDEPKSAGSEVGETIQAEGGAFTRVSPEELNRVAETQDFVLVNTHIPFAGDLPRTDLSIPYDEIADNLDELPGKDQRIVLYCQGGPMSDEAARTLVGLGYTDVWDLGGGMDAWQSAGFDLVGV
ncbi:MAG: rhodanese-like domain-containing protein [Rubrobacter sp.]